MRVFIAGGTGYVGRQVMRDLVAAGHSVTALVRAGSEEKVPHEVRGKIAVIKGSALDTARYAESLALSEACINLPGLLREFPGSGISFEEVHFAGTKALVDTGARSGTLRFIQMSALGAREGALAKYQETKFRAEEYVKASPHRWTIFRPSVIFGNEKEGLTNFFTVLADLLTMAPFVVPVLGDGRYRFQPVALANVSEGFIKALTLGASVGKTYDVAGPDRYSYNELLDSVAHILGRHKLKLNLPMVFMKAASSLLGRFQSFPLSRDQITMLEEESISGRWREFFEEFQVTPLRFMENVHKGF